MQDVKYLIIKRTNTGDIKVATLVNDKYPHTKKDID